MYFVEWARSILCLNGIKSHRLCCIIPMLVPGSLILWLFSVFVFFLAVVMFSFVSISQVIGWEGWVKRLTWKIMSEMTCRSVEHGSKPFSTWFITDWRLCHWGSVIVSVDDWRLCQWGSVIVSVDDWGLVVSVTDSEISYVASSVCRRTTTCWVLSTTGRRWSEWRGRNTAASCATSQRALQGTAVCCHWHGTATCKHCQEEDIFWWQSWHNDDMAAWSRYRAEDYWSIASLPAALFISEGICWHMSQRWEDSSLLLSLHVVALTQDCGCDMKFAVDVDHCCMLLLVLVSCCWLWYSC